MELVDLKISRYPDLIKGIVIKNGTQWLALEENIVDYVLDGFLFVNKYYVQQVSELSHDTLRYKVLSIKHSSGPQFPCLDNYADLIKYLRDKRMLIAIGRNDQKSILVGRIADFTNDTFCLIPIGVDLQELPRVKIDCKKIRYISIMSDYLMSITDYLKVNEQTI